LRHVPSTPLVVDSPAPVHGVGRDDQDPHAALDRTAEAVLERADLEGPSREFPLEPPEKGPPTHGERLDPPAARFRVGREIALGGEPDRDGPAEPEGGREQSLVADVEMVEGTAEDGARVAGHGGDLLYDVVREEDDEEQDDARVQEVLVVPPGPGHVLELLRALLAAGPLVGVAGSAAHLAVAVVVRAGHRGLDAPKAG